LSYAFDIYIDKGLSIIEYSLLCIRRTPQCLATNVPIKLIGQPVILSCHVYPIGDRFGSAISISSDLYCRLHRNLPL
jgi:hypothetical protein